MQPVRPLLTTLQRIGAFFCLLAFFHLQERRVKNTLLKVDYHCRRGGLWGPKSRTPCFGGSPATQRQLGSVGEAVHAALPPSVLGGLATPAPGMDAPRTATPARAPPHLLTLVPLSTSLVDFT